MRRVQKGFKNRFTGTYVTWRYVSFGVSGLRVQARVKTSNLHQFAIDLQVLVAAIA